MVLCVEGLGTGDHMVGRQTECDGSVWAVKDCTVVVVCCLITEASVDRCMVWSLRGTARDGSGPVVRLLDERSGGLFLRMMGSWRPGQP